MFLLTLGDLPLLLGPTCLGSQASLCLHQLTSALAGLQVTLYLIKISDERMEVAHSGRYCWTNIYSKTTQADMERQLNMCNGARGQR